MGGEALPPRCGENPAGCRLIVPLPFPIKSMLALSHRDHHSCALNSRFEKPHCPEKISSSAVAALRIRLLALYEELLELLDVPNDLLQVDPTWWDWLKPLIQPNRYSALLQFRSN